MTEWKCSGWLNGNRKARKQKKNLKTLLSCRYTDTGKKSTQCSVPTKCLPSKTAENEIEKNIIQF